MGAITRQGRQLMLNGNQYKFAGVNADAWFGCWQGEREATNDANLDRFFRELNPHSMTRLWVYRSSQGDIDLLRKIVGYAAKYQQYLMVTLSDGNDNQCGSLRSGYPADGGAVLNHVRTLVPQFAATPAIAVWEIINEGSTSAANAPWYNTIGREIKRLDPDSLVASGAGTCWNGTAIQNCQAVNNPEWNDLVSMHEYDYNNGGVSHHAQNTEALAASLGLPWFAGEWGLCCGGSPSGIDETQAVNIANQEARAYLNASGSAGSMNWDFKWVNPSPVEPNPWDAMWNVFRDIRHQWQGTNQATILQYGG